ncbi:hypothetical protein [Catelliglobosispora koreensis]|uniref:hypothetical protein n=1 Tax=Catelliglobosispora koreensis TaxID=129052 RepID=UPI000476CE72|nr:hypothetical protein [Catelliglobosispora koreensis]
MTDAPPPGSEPVNPVSHPSDAAMAKPKDNAQLYGIIGVIAAFICCPPLGILFGWMSMTEAKKLGRDDTLGKVAFWAGIVVTAGWLLSAVAWACLGGAGMMWGNR